MEKMTGAEHFPQASPDFEKPLSANHETMRTLGAMVAILGATLGVNVNQALAETAGAQPDEKPGTVKLNFAKVIVEYVSDQSKLELDGIKKKIDRDYDQTEFDATQRKLLEIDLDSTQTKLDSGQVKTMSSIQMKLDKPVLEGETLIELLVVISRNGGPPVSTPTRPDGTFEFKGLAPGPYNLSVGGKFVKTFDIGSSQSLSGQFRKGPDGTASLSINGLIGTSQIESASLVVRKASDVPMEYLSARRADTAPVTPVNGIGGLGGGRPTFYPGGRQPTENGFPLPASRIGASVATGDVNGDGRTDFRVNQPIITKDVDNLVDLRTAPGGPSAAGLVKTGTGVLTLTGPDVANIGSSNRDRLGQDAQADSPRVALANPSTGPVGQDTNTPVSNIVVLLKKEPGGQRDPLPAGGGDRTAVGSNTYTGATTVSQGVAFSALTGGNGTFEFKGLEAGRYQMTVGGQPAPSLNVETDGVAGGRLMKGPDGRVSVFDRKGVKLQDLTLDKPVFVERFGNRGVSGFGNGAGPGGMTPPIPSMMAPGPSPMSAGPKGPGPVGPGPMGPGAMGGGAGRR